MNKILILGGTHFIGRNLVEQLLGHSEFEITLFNRQRTGPDLFPGVNMIKGDRGTDDIKQISQQQWDYVIDLSCYFPAHLTSALDNLRTSPRKYIFISTCSVYDNEQYTTPVRNEDAPILGCTLDQAADTSTASYGNRKAECERILQASGLEHVILRPALVFGSYDPTDRFYYWLYQVRMNDTLLLPDNGERTFSITYVKDLVDALIASLRMDQVPRVINAITEPRISIVKIINEACMAMGKTPDRLNASPEFLKENGIEQWSGMPLWIDGDHFTYSNQRMTKALNIATTEITECILQTIGYYGSLNWPKPIFGLSEADRLRLLRECEKMM